MEKLFQVSQNPHARDGVTTGWLMRMVILSLLPATAFGVWSFGLHALWVVLISVCSSVLIEFAFEKGMKKPVTIQDGSAVVTGLLIALNMPVGVPLWMPVLGAAFAIIIVKQLYGGLGQNFMNPALAARCFLLISFAKYMTDFSTADTFRGFVDAATGATPLAVLKSGGEVPLFNLFFGTTQGTIGETSALMLLIGAAVLVAFRVIRVRIPLAYLGSFSLFYILYSAFNGGISGYGLLCQLCGGGLMLGAWFMATDYATSPITPVGQWVYGIALGALTGVFRFLGSSSEGVSYAILIGNLLVPVIERYTRPRVFGKGGRRRAEK